MKRRGYGRIGRVVSRYLFPEARIIRLADDSTLRQIAEKASLQSRRLALSLTTAVQDTMYRLRPDGERIRFKEPEPVKTVYKRDHVFSIKAAS